MDISQIEDNETVTTSEVEKSEAANPTDLEKLLAGYNEPAKVDLPPTPVPSPQPTNNPAPVNQPNWKGNPLYYQRGKKAGQLRPNGARPFYNQPVNMSVNGEPSTISGDIISGALFLTIINVLCPMLFSLVNNMVSKKKIAYEDMQIDEKTLKQLDELSNKALKHIKIEANPVGVLLFTMVGLYAMQFMTIKMLSDIKPKINVSK